MYSQDVVVSRRHGLLNRLNAVKYRPKRRQEISEGLMCVCLGDVGVNGGKPIELTDYLRILIM